MVLALFFSWSNFSSAETVVALQSVSLHCEANPTNEPRATPPKIVTITTTVSDDPVLLVRSTDKELNFVFGQKRVAGLSFKGRNDLDCTPTLKSSELGIEFD